MKKVLVLRKKKPPCAVKPKVAESKWSKAIEQLPNKATAIWLKVGEDKRFSCNNCSKDFDIVCEPTYANWIGELPVSGADVTCCPFCGSSKIVGN